jgi:hypothetical protein
MGVVARAALAVGVAAMAALESRDPSGATALVEAGVPLGDVADGATGSATAASDEPDESLPMDSSSRLVCSRDNVTRVFAYER